MESTRNRLRKKLPETRPGPVLSGLQRTIDESDVFQAEADKAVLPEQTMDEAVESFPDSFQPLDDSVDPYVCSRATGAASEDAARAAHRRC